MSIKQGNQATFSHMGRVSRITKKAVFVTLSQNVHCASCGAKTACGVSEAPNKEIEIDQPSETFRVEEQVHVVLKKTDGMKAIFWAYVMPFLLLLAVLLTTSPFLSEWQSGLLALAILVPYFLMLYRFDAFFKKKMHITIEKLN